MRDKKLTPDKKKRTILAVLFLISVSIAFLWSLKEDYDLIRIAKGLEKLEADYIATEGQGIIRYSLQLNSFDVVGKVINCSLSLRTEKMKEIIFYGPIMFDDCSEMELSEELPGYYDFDTSFDNISFSNTAPAPVKVTIRAFGKPEIYPFDKYSIGGRIYCPAYFEDKYKKTSLRSLKRGESLSITNSMRGLLIRPPFPNELPIHEELMNFKNRFVLVMVRPFYLRFMTIILITCAIGTSSFIGFRSSLSELPIQIIGYIVGVWGIRSILLSETALFLTYLDYALLFTYLVAFTGIIFRLIRGKQ